MRRKVVVTVVLVGLFVLSGCADPNNKLGLTEVKTMFDQSNNPVPVQGVAHQTSGHPSSINSAIFIQNKDGSVEKVAEASVGGKALGLEVADIVGKTAAGVFFGTTFGSTIRVSPGDQISQDTTANPVAAGGKEGAGGKGGARGIGLGGQGGKGGTGVGIGGQGGSGGDAGVTTGPFSPIVQ